jgi:hypothetical protein
MADRVIKAMGGSVKGKTIGVLGLAFKPNTDDMRDAPSLDIIPALQAAGARVKAYDPESMHEAGTMLTEVDFCDGPYNAIDGADAVLGVLDDGGPARDALLGFWGWTGGQARGGVWLTATKRLQKARKHLHPVSLALFSTTAAEVLRWSSQLDDLERLQPHAWRVCVPRFWRL